ncbi:hypothetical protein [Marinilabilia rubra]|nr:hypothetical protein [Marinilabilia rubra]
MLKCECKPTLGTSTVDENEEFTVIDPQLSCANLNALSERVSALSDSAINDTLHITPVDFFISFEKDSLKKAWKDYRAWLNSIKKSASSEGVLVIADSISEEQYNEYASRSGTMAEDSLKRGESYENHSSSDVADKISKFHPEISQSENISKDKYSRYPFHFVIQVAASKTELDSLELEQEYTGPFEIRELEEEGWYKYQIGLTENYLEALEILKSVSSTDRFLVAYNADGEKLKLWKAVLSQRHDLIRYRVQIAASMIPLSDEKILEIYDGKLKILIVEEDGWFKYQIDLGKNYQQAREKKQLIDVEGAFMVPYLGEEKMPLYKVLKFYSF